MHWGRAKNVLIYAFLLLNLVLGYQLWNDLDDQNDSSLDLTSLANSIQKQMDEKSIELRTSIPKDTPALPKINYRLLQQNNRRLPIQLSQPVDSKLIFNPTELIAALKPSIPTIQNYRYDAHGSRDGVFVLHPLIDEKWPLFNMNLELNYSNQKVASYQMSKIEVSEMDEEDVQKVLSASKALGLLIEKFLPNNTSVVDVELGYYGEVFNSDAQVAAPAWRFTVESGQYYYVLGGGEVISPGTGK
ncbi:regulatory protein YycI of two-component signal transduction system YycFG [Paenibacillus shirakamiensis]|uniref:Regulatory protein YycI of two-component signal transduction system YycFG n=1 Tax=Paenibacillus shirakamiensis TaxID=1265935 RepID=A0ABS4JNW8_9BACL|nr:two-component system regulatory protein YycI [Paenibacillus shirakamiensis]MBP2002319.1 regulatory protein YycI of two-component signal transduction system YycFG [Paenibacillus shirakamiensis]